MTVTELSRAAWGAGPLGSGHVVDPAQFVGLVVHHTVIVMPDYDHDSLVAGDLDDAITYMRQLQHARPDLGDEVPYSFVVFEGTTELDCILAEGRGLGVTGAHTIGYNSTRYGVAFAGDFTDHAPTAGMWEGVKAVGRKLVNPAGAHATLEHRDVYATQCPGNSTPSPALAQPPFSAAATEADDMTPAQCRDKVGRKWFFWRGPDHALHASVPAIPANDITIGGLWSGGFQAMTEDTGLLVVVGVGVDGQGYQALIYTDGNTVKPAGTPPEIAPLGFHPG